MYRLAREQVGPIYPHRLDVSAFLFLIYKFSNPLKKIILDHFYDLLLPLMLILYTRASDRHLAENTRWNRCRGILPEEEKKVKL